MKTKLILCDCGGTQSLDSAALEASTGLATSRVHTALCTGELGSLEAAMSEGDVLVACAQMEATFTALAEDLEKPHPGTVDIRDRAGWSDEGKNATAKMAALVAEAQLPRTGARLYDLNSEGRCLVFGPAEAVLPAARRLAEYLAVTAAVTDGIPDLIAPEAGFDVVIGTLKKASGAFTRFAVELDGFATPEPSGRGAPTFSNPKDGAKATCDVLVDLSGAQALFPAHEKRDGYFRAAPADLKAIESVILEASHLIGTFEKPFYIRFEESLCAHSRAGQPACNRCLNLCPTGAITPNGDTVAINADICAGCGACAAACPSSAASYDAPPVTDIFRRLNTLASTYRKAADHPPRLLVHDVEEGREMIALSARYGRGLPADVIPFEITEMATFGHAEQLAALATGFGAVTLLATRKTEREGLGMELSITEAIAGEGAAQLIDPEAPDQMEALVWQKTPSVLPEGFAAVLPLGGRRETTRLAAKALHPGADTPLLLPQGAPYGAVVVDRDACTLCLACAGLCPPGALSDDPDHPRLLFQQDACLQCGLCANVCPENAITLVPEMNLADSALREQVVNEEEPADCIECGRAFGVKSTIDRIIAKLEGKHPMFIGSDNARLIQMCDDCRVNAQYHSEAQPFASTPRPRPRTTDDYN